MDRELSLGLYLTTLLILTNTSPKRGPRPSSCPGGWGVTHSPKMSRHRNEIFSGLTRHIRSLSFCSYFSLNSRRHTLCDLFVTLGASSNLPGLGFLLHIVRGSGHGWSRQSVSPEFVILSPCLKWAVSLFCLTGRFRRMNVSQHG